MKIYYYISGHGFGHVSRSSVLLEALLQREEVEEITVVSERTDRIQSLSPKLKKRKRNLDVGLVQKDSLSFDLDLTKQALEELEKQKPRILEEEEKFLKDHGYNCIITDASSLPITLGCALGIPAIFLGNFTWDFIYRAYAEEDPYFFHIAELMRVEYSFASLALQLPFSCPMPEFLETVPLGLVARRPTLPREEIRRELGWSRKTVWLLSFGAYGLDANSLDWEKLPQDVLLVAEEVKGMPSRVQKLPSQFHYPNLVRAADCVFTKPGYGILSECLAAGTPLVYTERGAFAEVPTLERALQKYFSSAFLSRSDWKKGNWSEAFLKAQKKIPEPLDFSWDGIPLAVESILEFQA